MQISHPVLSTAPASYPITRAEAKLQCEIASDDNSHDTIIDGLIATAVEQFENDCDMGLILRSYYVHLPGFPEVIDLPKRPLSSVTEIKYYDAANSLQTLSSSVYSANIPARRIELAVDQVWPSTETRWDAVKVTYVVGYANAAATPAAARHATLLLVGYYFGQNRGDNDRANDMAAYRRLVQQYLRSTYP